MVTFPALNTGAVAQYPAERHVRFSTRVLQFVDGQEQRFREFNRGLRRWVVRLDLLDDSELAAVRDFVETSGIVETFVFTDPWDGSTHRNCVIENREFAGELAGEGRNRTEIVIREDGEPWSYFHS